MATPDQGNFGKLLPLDSTPFSGFSVVTPKSLEEGGLDDIPNLSYSLEQWKKGDSIPMTTRAIILGQAQISTLAIMMAYECLDAQGAPYLFVTYPPTNYPREKTVHLEQHAETIADTLNTSEPLRSVRTVTLALKTELVLTPVMITTLGGSVEKDTRRAIATDLNASNPASKNATLNPELIKWDPALFLGMMPGIVGPFVDPWFARSVAAWYYLPEDVTATAPVEIAISFTDSLIVQKQAFEVLLGEYEKRVLEPGFYRKIGLGEVVL